MRVNRAIRAPEVRVISGTGEQLGILSIDQAKSLAEEDGLDLVEISPNADPPVCKIMNYGKYKFQQAKKNKEAKSKQKQILVKEVKFKPRIDEHDYLFKCKHIRRFLEQGNKVRAFVHFRGRERAHLEIGLKILERIIVDVNEIAVVEKRPSMEGSQMAMYLAAQEGAIKVKAKPVKETKEREEKESVTEENQKEVSRAKVEDTSRSGQEV
jgi:translation initiation factor IF-3